MSHNGFGVTLTLSQPTPTTPANQRTLPIRAPSLFARQ